jgi:hypothetical protein
MYIFNRPDDGAEVLDVSNLVVDSKLARLLEAWRLLAHQSVQKGGL